MKTKILFWGGGYALDYVGSFFNLDMIEVVGVVDKNPASVVLPRWCECKVYFAENIEKLQYDVLFISTINYLDEVYKQALNIGVNQSIIMTPYITKNQMMKWHRLFSDRGLQQINFLADKKMRDELNTQCRELRNLSAELIKLKSNGLIKQIYEQQTIEFLNEHFVENASLRECMFTGRDEFRKYVATAAKDKEGLFLEFGVFSGRSINTMAKVASNKTLYGFDSFCGLPEDWHDGYQKGKYDLKGMLPDVENNVRLIKGWFQDTLPDFLEQHLDEKCALVHIDCDLYSSTNYVLNSLKERICSGTILVFDEFLGYVNYDKHEYLAFNEFAEKQKLDYRYLACSSTWNENGYYVAVAMEIV